MFKRPSNTYSHTSIYRPLIYPTLIYCPQIYRPPIYRFPRYTVHFSFPQIAR